MKLISLFAFAIAPAIFCVGSTSVQAANEDGVAVAIVFDTSGSMKEPVKDAAGNSSPKYIIANRALSAIANRLQTFATNEASASPRKIKAGLFVFKNDRAFAAVPFGTFDAEAFLKWAREFASPAGATPLGATVEVAGDAVLKSGFSHKHVLVITDGINTLGPDPTATLAKLQHEAGRKQEILSVHFVAFDVAAKVFDGVKKQGATVVAASNESQLKTQLEFILETKILLEAEEPKK